MPWTPSRRGQWVSTSMPIIGAHTTPDGRPVGIHHPAGNQLAAQPAGDGSGNMEMVKVPVEASVTIVAPDGQDLYTLQGREAKPVRFHPDELPDLQPVVEADHLPESRRAHLEPGTKLRA